MNIGYIFDIDKIISDEDLRIPYISGLYYKCYNSKDFTLNGIIKFRDEVMLDNKSGEVVDKHIFYVVIKNNNEAIKRVSMCLSDMQRDKIHFNQEHYEVHVLLNLIEENGVSLKDYENIMQCLKDNSVCVYTWLLDKYDYTVGMPIIDARRSHAIVRMAYIINNHREQFSIRQVSDDCSPIYTIFGDSSVFFNEDERDQAVRYFYYYKNLQYLLNIPDEPLDDYLEENIFPFQNDKAEMEKRLDSSSMVFLYTNRVPIEATYITHKTQGLLLKSSDADSDYLINATDNRLVFIDDLSRKQKWQMSDMETFVKECWERMSHAKDLQETISEDFISGIQERVIIHKRTVFDKVNNEVSQNRKKQVDDFKTKIDKYLLDYLNNSTHNYTEISEILTPLDAKGHHSNIDCGIAFLKYLESGNVDYFSDLEMSAGDINLLAIHNALSEEKDKRRLELEEKEKEINEYYKDGVEGKPSKIKSAFAVIDQEIKQHTEEIKRLTFQLENWFDEDTPTARFKAFISFACGTLISGLWAFIYFRWLSNIFDIDKEAIWLIGITLILGIIIGVSILLNIVFKRREAEEKLRLAKEKKRTLMSKCIKEMKDLVEKRYLHMLAFHGLKTVKELLEYVKRKEDDLLSFRKTIFCCLVNYRLLSRAQAEHLQPDSNTIELNDIDVNRLLFGMNDDKKIPFIFSRVNGITLADAFDDFFKKKVRFKTTRFSLDYKPQEEFDPIAIEKEIISCRESDVDKNIQYSALNGVSVLPDKSGVEIEDVNQGQCGDCYFMATLASIAQMNPEYIVGEKGMIGPLGTENRYFRVKFYDQDGNRVNVDIDNKFWNKSGTPIYAGIGKSKDADSGEYDPWVMAVEKAWAKLNRGYDNIEGASSDGQERVRMVEYSYAVTGKSAFYCMTKNVSDRQRLLEMIKKHVLVDKLPITLYSASPSDMGFPNKDPYLVENHAYSLRSVNEGDTFDIFNPWNNYKADEDVRGKHYDKVDINFIKDNFDVVVFFGIKEADFSSFERELTGNASEIELATKIEELMNNGLNQLNCETHKLEELMTEDVLNNLYIYSDYLCNGTRIKDKRGIDKNAMYITYIEPVRGCDGANEKLKNFLKEKGDENIVELNVRSDDKKSLTILRITPHYVIKNFNDTEN